MIQVGLDIIADSEEYQFKGKRLAYLSNQASVSKNLIHGKTLLKNKYGDRLTCLFSPQHGFFSEKQDNMIESPHLLDVETGLKIYSLYGEHRRPTNDMFQDIDVLLVDLVDVGTRVYTFIYTLAYCMEVAAELGKKIVILDRPNPIGGKCVEGNLIRSEYHSFVGLYPIPMRHGLTLGEFAAYINIEHAIHADLEIISMNGWTRDMYFRQTGFPWVSPSPNMPTPETAIVYPGQVIWEGTNISEGRGTTQPFEFVGAPFWNHRQIEDQVSNTDLPGCYLRPIVFEPTSGKWAGCSCTGFQIHVNDLNRFKPYRTSLCLLQACLLLYQEGFEYKQPPYEYEFNKLPMDLILGDQVLRKQLEAAVGIEEIEDTWQTELLEFKEIRKEYLLY